MKKTNMIKFGSALSMMAVLIGALFVPSVLAQSDNSLTSQDLASSVTRFELPSVDIKENTATSQVVQVDDVLIDLKANADHTHAIMTIEDTVSGDVYEIIYEVSESNGIYSISTYIGGELYGTQTTDFDPFEPGAAFQALRESSSSSQEIVPMQEGYHYWWDGVYFVGASYQIKYSHPDYDAYQIGPWEDCYINGNNLRHTHINNGMSSYLGTLGAAAAGAAIGAMIGGPAGAVVGVVLGGLMGALSTVVLLDEKGCIWFWTGHNYEIKLFFFGLFPTVAYVPNYWRIATYTLWDDAGVGNP